MVSAGSCDDPIESYGSNKPNNEEMEIDLEGSHLPDSKPKQAEKNRSRCGDKPSKEAIAAIAGPQKPRHNTGRPDSPKKTLQLRTTMLVGRQVSLSSSTPHYLPKTERRKIRR